MTVISAILFFICLSFLIVILGLLALVLLLRKNITITTFRQRQDADAIEVDYTLQSLEDDDDIIDVEAYEVPDALPAYRPYDKQPRDRSK